jgi:hypothetical protein
VFVSVAGHVEIVQKLIEFDAEFDIEEDIDRTPLFWACYNNHVEVVKLLLEKGARVNIVDSAGLSPTMVASHCGHADILRLLQEHSAYEVFYYTGQKEQDKPAEFIRTRAIKDVDKLCGGGNSLFYKVTNECSHCTRPPPTPHTHCTRAASLFSQPFRIGNTLFMRRLLFFSHSSIQERRSRPGLTPRAVTTQALILGETRRSPSGTTLC